MRERDKVPTTAISRAVVEARKGCWDLAHVHGAGMNRIADACSKLIEDAVHEAILSGELVPVDEHEPMLTEAGFRWLRGMSDNERRLMADQVARAICISSPAYLAAMLADWRFTAGCLRDPEDLTGKPYDPATWTPDGSPLPQPPPVGEEPALDEPPDHRLPPNPDLPPWME